MTKYSTLNVRPETKQRLDSICYGKKTYDQLINELIEWELDFKKKLRNVGVDEQMIESIFVEAPPSESSREVLKPLWKERQKLTTGQKRKIKQDLKKENVSAGNTDKKTSHLRGGQES